MRTPDERRHDQWARAYLAAALRRDEPALLHLLGELHPVELWDTLDAVAATARDVVEVFTTAEAAADVLARQLLLTALQDTTRP